MNKQTKLAIIIAPFLAIGGFIAADYYARQQYIQERYLALQAQGECKIRRGECKLGNGDFLINIEMKKEMIRLAATHPISNAVVSLVDAKGQETLYKLEPQENALNWHVKIPLMDNQAMKKIRLLLTINQYRYLGEVNISD